MTSESSSAVLDLNDADTEDTDAASVSEDLGDGVPLIMETGYDIAVRVDAPMKQLSTLETYVTYRVRCVCARWPTPPAVRRRYNHFKWLHRRLVAAHPWSAPPPPPPLHSAREQLDRYAPAFVNRRTWALHHFLDCIVKHPIFTHCPDLRSFLTAPDGEADKLFRGEGGALGLWGLGALYGGGEAKQTNGARVKDPEWAAHAEYLTSLQHKLSTLSSLAHKMHKGSAELSAEIDNMKRVCAAWSVSAGGAVGRAAGALAAPHAGPPAPAPPPPAHAGRAHALAHLAAYTEAHVMKIKQRDALHAAYVAGTTPSGELHNKLEQASAALRAELADWAPKARGSVKAALLSLAAAQAAAAARAAAHWDCALRLARPSDPHQLFKTVSKSALHNLSPSARPASSDTDRVPHDTSSESINNDWVLTQGGADPRGPGTDRSDSFRDILDSDSGESKVTSEKSSRSELNPDPLRELSDVDLS